MNIIEWLMNGDPVIQRLTKKYLLDDFVVYEEEGYIGRYLSLFNLTKKQWGNGIYSPKWISTHYTLLELRYMEINPGNPIYQTAVINLLNHLWVNKGKRSVNRYQDMCIIGMMLGISTYGRLKDERIYEMIDHILEHQFLDGGWNCEWESDKSPKISSVHTTLSVLEGLGDYDQFGYRYRNDELQVAILKGIELLLKRRLYQTMKANRPIHEDMTTSHYPPRWKYDYMRALEFLVLRKHPYDERMTDSLHLLTNQIRNGRMVRGSQHSGKIHFTLEKTTYGRFNTLRALKVLKCYQKDYYNQLISMIEIAD